MTHTEKAYKFRIYPNKEQEILIQKTFGCTRHVYNHYLAMRKEMYESDKRTLNYNACSADMTQMKKEKEWLREVDATALQSSLKNLDFAYQNFFRRVKNGDTPGYPRFKSKRDNRKSYVSKRVGENIKVLDKHIQLPKLGRVSCRISKEVKGRILSATVSQNPSGRYFVSVLCADVEILPMESTSAMVGIDLGIKELAITSDNQHFENHKHYANAQKRLARLQRQLSRKSKGSANRNKARIKVARLHEHIANQRTDAIHKMTTDLVRDYDLICTENLVVKNMVKNRKLSKAISDVAWGEIVRQLEYKCAWYGKTLVKIGRYFPSSQTCGACGFTNRDVKNLNVRDWTCPECGAYHDRDVNAAKNILEEGLRIVNQSVA